MDEITKKMAERLVYLWDLREKDPYTYQKLKLGEEKEEIYSVYPYAVMLAREYWENPKK